VAEIKITLTDHPRQKPADETKLGFGIWFTNHMFQMRYEKGKGWIDPQILPYGPLSLDPAAVVLHYAQEIFEGTKCYRRRDGRLQLFRPEANFRRMSLSAERMCMPPLDEETVLEGLKKLIIVDKDWMPHTPGTSLYIRPTMIATDAKLGVHASGSYLFYIILSPVGAYYQEGLAPVGIYVEDQYVRAVRGGVGYAKTGGNYAASILAGEQANAKGFSQVLWLDGVERKYVEEVGAMNMMFVYRDRIVTPELNGSILPGITRSSVMTLAQDMGYRLVETKVPIQTVFKDVQNGTIREIFGTGTAAVISPVGKLAWNNRTVTVGDGGIGALSRIMYDTLTGIQSGVLEDKHHWTVPLP
jgi:branched-chain amino acid aminotransferase